jgi:hypothetical protein
MTRRWGDKSFATQSSGKNFPNPPNPFRQTRRKKSDRLCGAVELGMVGKERNRRVGHWDLPDWLPWLRLGEAGMRDKEIAELTRKHVSSIGHARRRLAACTADEIAEIEAVSRRRLQGRVPGKLLVGDERGARICKQANAELQQQGIVMIEDKTGTMAAPDKEAGPYDHMSDDEIKAVLRSRIERQADRLGFRRELDEARARRARAEHGGLLPERK